MEKFIGDGRDVRDDLYRRRKQVAQGAVAFRRNVPMLVGPPMEVQRAPQHFSANRQTDAKLRVGQRLQCLSGVVVVLGPVGRNVQIEGATLMTT